MASATPAWRRNRTSIFARPILIGPTPITTSRSCITARSPIIGSCREMERLGHRFMSNCDSELLAVYTANNLEQGATLEDSLKSSIKDIDGVFTYLVATASELGMSKHTLAAKPMVMFES